MAQLICAECMYEGRDQRDYGTRLIQIAVVDGDSLCKGHAERALRKRHAEDAAKERSTHDPRYTPAHSGSH